MTKQIIIAVLLAGFLGACGSSDSSNSGSTSTHTGTTTGPSSKTFTASCMMVTNIGSGATAVSFSLCHEYYNSVASAIQTACTSKPGDTMAMTYSTEHCPTANLQGTCTRSGTGDVDYYYDGGTMTKSTNQTACASSGDAWAEP